MKTNLFLLGWGNENYLLSEWKSNQQPSRLVSYPLFWCATVGFNFFKYFFRILTRDTSDCMLRLKELLQIDSPEVHNIIDDGVIEEYMWVFINYLFDNFLVC